MLAHSVFFTLKDRSESARQKLVSQCRTYLSDHPGIAYFYVGALAEGFERDVNDRDFDVALTIIFEDRASHDAYQAAETHHKFIDEAHADWAQVRVFDSES